MKLDGTVLIYDPIIDLVISFNLVDNGTVAGKIDEKIITVSLFFDFIGEMPFAPLVNLGNDTFAVGNDGLTSFD